MKKLVLLIFILALAACAPAAPAEKSETDTLTVMTHDSFAISEEVVAAFEGGYVNNVVTFLLNRTPSIAVKVGLEAATVIVFKFLLAKNPVHTPEL